MTYPPPPPPGPDQPYDYRQMPDGSWLATPAGQQTPPPAPVKPVNPKLAFWTSAPGIFSMLAIMAAVVVLIVGISDRVSGPASDNFETAVTSCEASGSTATVGLSVKNLSKQTRTARVKVEYRDGAGNRLDTDTATVRNIAPGDTALTEETTLLDSEPSASARCIIVGVS